MNYPILQLQISFDVYAHIPSIDPMGIHLLHYAHGNEHTRTHDEVHNTFVAIAQNVGFHMGWEQRHVLWATTCASFNHVQFFSRWWIDIVLTKNGIHTLANIIIVDPTQAYLFPRSCTTQRFVTFNAIQSKEKNQHPTN